MHTNTKIHFEENCLEFLLFIALVSKQIEVYSVIDNKSRTAGMQAL